MATMTIDHLVFAGPSLREALAVARDRLGVRPAPGGQHRGLGTCNWLADLGGGAYLEIIGPDPAQPDPGSPRPFDIDRLREPKLVAWALRSTDIDTDVAEAAAAGLDLGSVTSMRRERPDGQLLHWQLTPPRTDLIPFVIDWGATEHPTVSLEEGHRLVGLRLETSEPAPLRRALEVLGVDGVDVVEAPGARMVAAVETDGAMCELS